MSEPLRVLKRPLVASSAGSAISTCCSRGSLASVYSSSHLCPSPQQRGHSLVTPNPPSSHPPVL